MNPFKYLPPAAILVLILLSAVSGDGFCQGSDEVFPGADARTPSRAFFFDWISSQYEGTTESQALAFLDFFQWLHDEYGLELDIYSLDVGNIDDGPFTAGVGRLIPDHWGTLDSVEFKRQFPNGFAPLVEKANSFGCRLGIWLGPDGFGDTPAEEQARIDMLVKLCRDYRFMLFKFDAVAGGLRKEKQDAFIRAIEECRKHCPDLIVLNERIDLGKAAPHATTDLWEGAETYIDVFSTNTQTAPHHRAGALSREIPPGLTRLLEDHGVCLSSCLDFWEDDLVLQAFNRCLILAPEIYGSPWLLRDDELPRLCRLCNLHRRHREILVDAMALPEARYGPFAVSRGTGEARFITLRNPTWLPIAYSLKLDASVGFTSGASFEVRRFHPSERILGRFDRGEEIAIEVLPFRACLIAASAPGFQEIGVNGCDYEVVQDLPDRPVVIRLLGLPGIRAEVQLASPDRSFSKATLDGEAIENFSAGGSFTIDFPGKPLKHPWHRRIGVLDPCPVPADAETLYEATCFAADSNALEVRSLARSGPTQIPQVENARRAFFEDPMFVRMGIWDRNGFDGDEDTFFMARYGGAVLRVDFGEPLDMDTIILRIKSRYERFISAELHRFAEDNRAEVSSDLKTWIPVGHWSGKGSYALARIPPGTPVRYLRVHGAPARIAEIEGYRDGALLDRSRWRASNLLGAYVERPAEKAWSCAFTLDEVPRGSYLAIALNGRHGVEGAYAALRVEGEASGAPDRSPSFPSNTWEYKNVESDRNYTYYVPLDEAMAGKRLDVFVLKLQGGFDEFIPEVYITAYPVPYQGREIVLFD